MQQRHLELSEKTQLAHDEQTREGVTDEVYRWAGELFRASLGQGIQQRGSIQAFWRRRACDFADADTKLIHAASQSRPCSETQLDEICAGSFTALPPLGQMVT